MPELIKKLILVLVVSSSVFIADHLTKHWIEKNMSFQDSVETIPGALHIVRVHNRGAAFGLFNNPGWKGTRPLLTAASFIALGIVIFFILKVEYQQKTLLASLSLILGGALGNLIDRIFKGYVVDMIYMHIGKYGWPAYNLADVAITIGVFAIIIMSMKEKEER